MNYNFLSKTGLRMSNIYMGTMTLGSKISTQQGVGKATAMALEEGINFFDTAGQYVDGMSEVMLGKILEKTRKEAVVASKMGYPYKGKTFFSLSRSSILDSIDGTLKGLETNYVDIYYLHASDCHTSLEKSLEAMNGVVRQEKVRYIGMSSYAAWQLCEAMYICRRNHWAMPIVSETCYDTLTRDAERELVPFLMDKEMGMTVFNPLAGGLLTGRYQFEVSASGTRFKDPAYQKWYWRQDNFHTVSLLEEATDRLGVSLLGLTSQWYLNREWVAFAITGFSNVTQLEYNITTLRGKGLPQETMDQVDVVWNEIGGGRVQYNR